MGKIAFAAAVHDISELAMNDFPMNKPGRFTGAGHLMVQQHVMLEASILDKLDLDPDISSMVLQHHENFDGSGYPNGLSGEQICLGTRIFRIVDTYDALTSQRGYRTPQSGAKALSIMEAEAKNFDPTLMEIFRSVRTRIKR